jgi:hypothetical protein
VNDRWGEAVMQTEEVAVLPKKTDIHVDLFGVAWLPFHVVQSPEGEIEVPGYGQS